MNLEVIASPELQKFGLPTFATPGAAAIDLRALLNSELTDVNFTRVTKGEDGRIESIFLAPRQQVTIDTGLKIHIKSRSHCALILPRSGTGSRGLVLANGTGLIDSDYQGPLLVKLLNRTDESILVADGERIAQYVLTQAFQFDMTQVEEFTTQSERGEGGFGSTGAV